MPTDPHPPPDPALFARAVQLTTLCRSAAPALRTDDLRTCNEHIAAITQDLRSQHLLEFLPRLSLDNREGIAQYPVNTLANISNSLRSIINGVQSLRSDFGRWPVVSESNILASLQVFTAMGGVIRGVNGSSMVAEWTSPPVEMTDCWERSPTHRSVYQMGSFRATLSLSRDTIRGGIGESFSVEALNPHPHSPTSNFKHPHLNGLHFCFGAPNEPSMVSLLRSGSIGEFFVFFAHALTVYNPLDAYLKLHLICSPPLGICTFPRCEAVIRESIQACLCHTNPTDPTRPICRDHANACNFCGWYYDRRLVTYCRACGVTWCDACFSATGHTPLPPSPDPWDTRGTPASTSNASGQQRCPSCNPRPGHPIHPTVAVQTPHPFAPLPPRPLPTRGPPPSHPFSSPTSDSMPNPASPSPATTSESPTPPTDSLRTIRGEDVAPIAVISTPVIPDDYPIHNCRCFQCVNEWLEAAGRPPLPSGALADADMEDDDYRVSVDEGDDDEGGFAEQD